MSDYGDDNYSDYDEDWFYVEDEYMVADDLAEHVVNSPPPTTYADEDAVSDWDRFDYFNDLEYASDGYDDSNFYLHKQKPQTAQNSQKRKRGGTGAVAGGHGKKRQKTGTGRTSPPPGTLVPSMQPVVWRAKATQSNKPKMLDESQEPIALLKDWRERLTDMSVWASATPPSPEMKMPKSGNQKLAFSERISPTQELEGEEDDDVGIDPAVLMAALQKNLADAGGPLNGMDPQQLLQFAMRMMTDKDAGDEIIGELADNILDKGDEEGDEEAPAELLSWLSKQRESNQHEPTESDPTPSSRTLSAPKSPDIESGGIRTLTPPSSDANRRLRAVEEPMDLSSAKGKNAEALNQKNAMEKAVQSVFSRKRKADDDERESTGVGSSINVSKKQATARSYDAPTAASQARATSTVRSGRSKRS
ncbi:uncharacterized protein BDR25DRAFT_304470 [Lindgomyces ingoldianus]|uniref:Uncharacterized protein n=1 Tax=Lindgomyces ingoldianus TaxID=673940 RepID=A0ACB6QR01_9PLEO|nr:uncharacterized protein BDR25DRAFT_304470 [Lindgomyces ingoldianus]KAF2469351.1 hypothetical protein BDR25DRAFT_304470 [Lindgomyces ingoldianus]